MKIVYALVLLILSIPVYSEPTTMKQKEKDEWKYVDSVRSNGFADRYIDRLHKSLASNIARIQGLNDRKYSKNTQRYLYHEPIPDNETVNDFNLDKDNKPFFKMNLGQGVTWEDYPTGQIYNTRAYIYLTDDGKGLAKVIFQFTRVNFTGTKYVKEMRRIINPTPLSPEPLKQEGQSENEMPKFQEERTTDETVKADTNTDIYVEYYSSHDKDVNWVDENPDLHIPPSLKVAVSDPESPLPFASQKRIIDTYRKLLKVADSQVSGRLRNIQQSQRALIRKMSEMNY